MPPENTWGLIPKPCEWCLKQSDLFQLRCFSIRYVPLSTEVQKLLLVWQIYCFANICAMNPGSIIRHTSKARFALLFFYYWLHGVWTVMVFDYKNCFFQYQCTSAFWSLNIIGKELPKVCNWLVGWDVVLPEHLRITYYVSRISYYHWWPVLSTNWCCCCHDDY